MKLDYTIHNDTSSPLSAEVKTSMQAKLAERLAGTQPQAPQMRPQGEMNMQGDQNGFGRTQ